MCARWKFCYAKMHKRKYSPLRFLSWITFEFGFIFHVFAFLGITVIGCHFSAFGLVTCNWLLHISGTSCSQSRRGGARGGRARGRGRGRGQGQGQGRGRARSRAKARVEVVKRIKQLRCLWMNLMMTWITIMLELSTFESFQAEELFCGIKYITSSQF